MKNCGNCKYHVHEDIDDGYVCVNSDSEHCTDWTDDNYSCVEWEGNDERQEIYS